MAELSQHPDVVDLAEYAEGLLDDSRRVVVDDHVGGCPDCSQTLSDLVALPPALAAAPLPPMPIDVAERLDRAIAAESEARASGWSGAAAQVTPLRPKRRWLAPVVAAAAVVGAVAIAVPVLDNESGSDDSASETADSAEEYQAGGGDLSEDGGPTDMSVPNVERGSIALDSDSFGRDVVDAFYSGSRELRVSSRPVLAEYPSSENYYAAKLDALPDPCGPDAPPDATIDDVTYDGEPARLLRQESGKTVDAVVYSCAGDTPTVLNAVTLRPRS